MCTLTIPVPDEILIAANMNQAEAAANMKEAFACRMFKEHRLALWQAARLCNMSKWEFCGVLSKNNIPVIDYPVEELEQEVAMLERMLS